MQVGLNLILNPANIIHRQNLKSWGVWGVCPSL